MGLAVKQGIGSNMCNVNTVVLAGVHSAAFLCLYAQTSWAPGSSVVRLRLGMPMCSAVSTPSQQDR